MGCHTCFNFVVFTATLQQLKRRCGQVWSLCWANSTWLTKKTQWKRYLTFCSDYRLNPAPATSETVCYYITYLTEQVRFSTITNYVSAIWSLHDFIGIQTQAKGSFLVKCTLLGAKRLLGNTTFSADPLLPEHLVRIYETLDHTDLKDLVFWSATCLAFRCLLRKSNYTSSPHMLRRRDIEFTHYGVCVYVHSSKTNQYKEKVLKIPVVSSPRSILCPVKWLKMYFKKCTSDPSAPLFLLPGKKPKVLSYNWYSDKLRSTLKQAGIQGRFSSHSLRRGCATYLSHIGMPLHDIKTYGDWKSLSVLLYLSSDVSSRLFKDFPVANHLNRYNV